MAFAALFLLATAASAAPSAQPVKQGVDYWQAGDFDRAAKAWLIPAQAGDADAQFNLAQAYKLGRGVPVNLRQAEAWYRKAAEQDHAQAGAMLGLIMFQNGDRKGAMPWIRKAAERGDPRAQYVYGTALFNGDETAKDWPRAYAMMTKAATAGLPQATASLGQMDQFVPLAERQAGLRLARGAPRVAGAEVRARREAAATVAAPAAVRPVAYQVAPPPAVRATDLPPSRYAAADPAPAATPKPVPAPKPAAATPKPAAAAPKPAAAKPVATAAPAKGGWRIQLGAYGDAAKARSAWTRLSAKGALHSLKPSFVKAGTVTRLQAGPFADRAAAVQACKTAGAACFPVAG